MAKLPRVTQKIFGSSAGFEQISQFGSLYASAPVFTTDIAAIQALSNYLVGWYNAAIGNNSPAIEDMNALFYLITTQMVYQFQQGIPEWDSGTTYYSGSIVSYPVYIFTCTSANATAGAIYTNNAQTFTVLATIAAGTTLLCSGTGAPSSSGTLTKSSGTGDATITFSQGVSSAGVYVGIADTNLNHVPTNTSWWQAMLPYLGLPYQKLSMNSTASAAEYSYYEYTPIALPASLTVPVGYCLNYGAMTVGTGKTFTVPSGASAFIGGDLVAVGDVVVSGDLTVC